MMFRPANTQILDQDNPSPPPSYKTNETSEFLTRPSDLSEDDEDEYRQQQSGQLPRRDGYDGRVQQVLYENPDLEILITDAGKSAHGKFIEYRIRTGVCKLIWGPPICSDIFIRTLT